MTRTRSLSPGDYSGLPLAREALDFARSSTLARPVYHAAMAIPLPDDVRALLEAPNYVHLSTLRADGSPRNWVVWIGVDGDNLLVCTGEQAWKAKDMRRDPRVGISVVDLANPYKMAAIQGRVIEVRSDHDNRYMDPISVKYTSEPFPASGADRVCFVIAAEKAGMVTLGFTHNPAQ